MVELAIETMTYFTYFSFVVIPTTKIAPLWEPRRGVDGAPLAAVRIDRWRHGHWPVLATRRTTGIAH